MNKLKEVMDSVERLSARFDSFSRRDAKIKVGDTKQIVIAWADMSALEATGRQITRDLNYFPEFKATWEGKAVMWVRKGTQDDIAKGEAYARSNGYKVFLYPPNESDPLGKAKTAVVAEAKAGKWNHRLDR